MHSPDKIQIFLDLRSKGNCLAYISSAIDVPVSTLSDWNRRYVVEIDASRAAKWESAEQSLQFNPEADLLRISQRIHACERELDRRPIARMTVGELVHVISLWRRESFRRRNRLLAPIEHPHGSVTPDVRRGLTSQATPEHPTILPADAAPDLEPESESKPEKAGIPESPAAHFPTFTPAHRQTPCSPPPAAQPGDPAPSLFSVEDHVPLPASPWRPSDFAIYRLPGTAAVLNHSNSNKTMIASSV